MYFCTHIKKAPNVEPTIAGKFLFESVFHHEGTEVEIELNWILCVGEYHIAMKLHCTSFNIKRKIGVL